MPGCFSLLFMGLNPPLSIKKNGYVNLNYKYYLLLSAEQYDFEYESVGIWHTAIVSDFTSF